ncbi:hypothetical protein [Streptomyces sp. NBC_00500]|uniref:hypothetical protein n=1 Tax=unclassified Streptomyces TaxID=2593676 RepID=UPI0030E408F9|nr:hypothetical protein OIC96_24990 [Streptomyces sp. NBC_00775]WUB28297.1 hypothetical protein OHA51_24745 [Streptomyces sp. NBC_00589]
MRRESIRGRRGALVGASATVVCLGTVLAACGSGGGGDGYVAVGAAGGSPRASGAVVAPTGDVSLMPLKGGTAAGSKGAGTSGSSGSGESTSTSSSTSASNSGSGETTSGSGTSDQGGGGTADGSGGTSTPSSGSGNSGGASGGSGSTSASPAPTAPGSTASAGPAVLSVGDPSREATDQRWCEKVTVSFRNTGGTAVRSGTVTFGTHIIGALGIDWATIESIEDLPAPIAAGAKKDKTWTVCVDAWRVPLGMHIETRDVSVRWK